MARLADLPKTDEWVWWSRALWRGAAACMLVTLLFSAWSFFPNHGQPAANGGSDLEDAVLASLHEAEVAW